MDLRCLWCSSISCLVQMNFTRPPDGWGLSEISINPFAWPWDHSITEPPLKKRRFCLFFNAKLMTLTQEALAAADRHQAGQSSATAAFCLWKVNCFLVASIVERLQRRHFEHKWHYSNSRNLRRLFWKFYLDKNHPSKTTYNTIIILYNIQAICRFASQRVNWRNCKLFSFQGLQASSKVSCSSAGRDRSTSGPFRAEAQGIPANWAVFKCSKFCESRNRRKGILSKRCWTQNDFAYFHLYYLISFHVIYSPGCPDVHFGWPNECGIKIVAAEMWATCLPSRTSHTVGDRSHTMPLGRHGHPISEHWVKYSLQWLPVSEHFTFEARLWYSLAIFLPHFHNQTVMCMPYTSLVNHGYTTSAVGSSLCKRSFVAAPCYSPNFPGAVNLVCELLWLLLVAELVAALTPWRHLRRPTPARLMNWCQSLATKPRSTKSTGSGWCSMKGRCIFLADRRKRPSTWCRLWRVVLGRP